MKLYTVELSYDAKLKIHKDQALWNKLCELEFVSGDSPTEYYYLPDSLLVAETELDLLTKLGITYTVAKVRGLHYDKADLPRFGSTEPVATSINHTHISVYNEALLAVRKVTVLEDICTNALQGYLDIGWRIIAVCPAHDRRRPDYILGHNNPEADEYAR